MRCNQRQAFLSTCCTPSLKARLLSQRMGVVCYQRYIIPAWGIKETNMGWDSKDRKGAIEQWFSNVSIYMSHLRILSKTQILIPILINYQIMQMLLSRDHNLSNMVIENASRDNNPTLLAKPKHLTANFQEVLLLFVCFSKEGNINILRVHDSLAFYFLLLVSLCCSQCPWNSRNSQASSSSRSSLRS